MGIVKTPRVPVWREGCPN